MQYEPGVFPIANLENAGQRSQQIKGAKSKHYTNNENMYNMSHGISGYSALAAMFGEADGSIAQGALYDIQDLSTLAQDATGLVVPVALEGAVGFVQDLRYGGKGNDLAAPAGWNLTLGTNGSVDGTRLSFKTAAIGGRMTTNVLTLGANQYYEIEVTIGQNNSGFRVGTAADGSNTGALINIITLNPGTYVYRIKSTAAGNYYLTYLCTLPDTPVSGSITIKLIPGNHAYQTDNAKRPIVSARYNQITETEGIAIAPWGSGGTAPIILTPNYGTAPNGTLTSSRIVFAADANSSRERSVGAQPAGDKVLTLRARSASGGTFRLSLNDGTVTTVSGDFTADGNWKEFKFPTTAANAGNHTFQIRNGTNAVENDIEVWGSDYRTAADAALNIPSYQRVNTAADYDSAGFPKYLKGNGTTQFLQTDAIDFTGTDKMTVIAGVGKLSDAAIAAVFEHGFVGVDPVNWGLSAPRNAGTGNYAIDLRNAGVVSTANSPSNFPAPVNSVVSGKLNFAGLTIAEQVNVRTNASDTGQSYSGAGPVAPTVFPNAAVYIMSRGPGNALWFGGRLYGLAICGRAVNPYPLFLAEEEMGSKMGIELS